MSARTPFLNPLLALDDRTLLARFAEQHDQGAFEQLVKRHGRLVFGVCRRAVRDAHLAEDAFQAVFLVLARAPGKAVEAASVGGWLFGTARRVGSAARRHEQRRERREARAAQPAAGAGAPGGDFSDLLCVLDEELGTMPEEMRAALVACFLEERTQDEAARELGWSVSTLRRRLESGKELLRSRLARRGVTLGAGLLAGGLGAPARAAVPALNPSPAATVLANEVLVRGVGLKAGALLSAVVLAVGGLAHGLVSDATPMASAGAAPAEVAPPIAEGVPWATVSGRVVFPKGHTVPGPAALAPAALKDASVWEPFAPLFDERVRVNAGNRGIADAVVWLRPDATDRRAEFPADRVHPALAGAKPQKHAVLAAAGQFRPRVVAARAGDAVVFENRLPVPTNVHYAPTDDGARDFNVLLGKGVAHTAKPLPALRAPDVYRSDIYPWMRGCVWAFGHPYFAVTGADGRFELKGVPAGAWRLVVWHEVAGYRAASRLGAKLTVPDGGNGPLELGPIEFESDDWPTP
ncbi:sigma-70 family RNA polymerase sigma factor [Gemmata sp. JC717]|uniref:sigma-70 family RNA polymerase sigma factor n=1 Tax=Gemmata algarum TaxID=2975278 RepID=UPI0021BB415F|nr:sigma-70 family RNA polymerase sigma factor [Gemmata algarum]MDY3553694.1 sigma-70 family RNA polymerase sigma factor [Gemmata algarum]